MQLFPSLSELRKPRNNTRPFANIGPIAVIRLYLGEESKAPPVPSLPEQDTPAWLLQPEDTDEGIVAALGAPLCLLSFSRVRYFPDHEQFLCHLVQEEEETLLVVPDEDWLDCDWRESLVRQL